MTEVKAQPPQPSELLAELKSELIRPVPPEYNQLARETGFVQDSTAYSPKFLEIVLPNLPSNCVEKSNPWGHGGHLYDMPMVLATSAFIEQHADQLSDLGKLLYERMKGARVVDLAAGSRRMPIIERCAETFKAREYIGVDASPYEDEAVSGNEHFHSFRLKNDALLTAVSFPDNSVDIIHISGFESSGGRKYFRVLIQEIKRILKPGGLIMTGPGCDTVLRSNEYFIENALDRIMIAIRKMTMSNVMIFESEFGFFPDLKDETLEIIQNPKSHKENRALIRLLYQNGYAVYEKPQQ